MILKIMTAYFLFFWGVSLRVGLSVAIFLQATLLYALQKGFPLQSLTLCGKNPHYGLKIQLFLGDYINATFEILS